MIQSLPALTVVSSARKRLCGNSLQWLILCACAAIVGCQLLPCKPPKILGPPAPPSLFPTPAYLLPGFPTAAVVADLDGDGTLDVVQRTVRGSSQSISVFKGTGGGRFEKRASYSLRGAACLGPLLDGDFDGDGKLDLATYTGSYIHIFFGKGDGSFESPVQVENTGTLDVAMGDVNGDGLSDILTVEDIEIEVRFNVGGRAFGAERLLPYRSGDAVALGDMNGDGRLDMVLHRAELYHYTDIYLGNGDGTFTFKGHYPGPYALIDLALRDFDCDGKPDVVMTEDNGSLVLVVRGIGDGSLELSYMVATDVSNRAIGDMNGDGFPDVVGFVGSSSSPAFGTLLNNGDGSVAAAVAAVVIGPGPRGQLIADLDGDGKNDVLFGASAGDYFWVEFGNGDGTFRATTSQVISVTTSIRALTAADVNGDGRPDLVVTHAPANTTGDQLSVFVRGLSAYVLTQTTQVGKGASVILVEDLDQDGHVDLVVLNRDDDDVSILRGRGDGTFHTEVRFGCGASPRDFAVADMNGDGTRDLVIANGAGSSVSVLLAIGDGTFQPDIIAPTSAQLFSLAVADFNNDGKQDVATGSTDKVLTLLGNGDGTLAPPATTMVSTGAVNDLVASDMGGSVGPDIASASAQAQSASLDILVRSDGAFTNELAFFLRDGRARRLALRTLDGDTLADIVALNDKDVSIFRSTTSNLFSYEARFRIAAGSDFAIADADGDGDLDIFTSGGTSIWVLLNQTF